jgi:hypothetical protein
MNLEESSQSVWRAHLIGALDAATFCERYRVANKKMLRISAQFFYGKRCRAFGDMSEKVDRMFLSALDDQLQ